MKKFEVRLISILLLPFVVALCLFIKFEIHHYEVSNVYAILLDVYSRELTDKGFKVLRDDLLYEPRIRVNKDLTIMLNPYLSSLCVNVSTDSSEHSLQLHNSVLDALGFSSYKLKYLNNKSYSWSIDYDKIYNNCKESEG